MVTLSIDKNIFKFQYLQEYARFLLEKNLEEFVTVGIRFSREADLPLLKPLSKYSEEQLVALSLDSNKKILEALIQDKIADRIEENANNWINNTLGVIDKDDIAAEDLTLAFYIRRKTFGFFLDAYTKNVYLQKFIIAELDHYTTQEELILYNIYLKMQTEKLNLINQNLELYKELLIEAQELGGVGSFLIDNKDESKSFFTPEYNRILELNDLTSTEQFLQNVHPEDQAKVKSMITSTSENGGQFEIEYRYITNKEKRIYSKGFTVIENGKPILIRGIVTEVYR